MTREDFRRQLGYCRCQFQEGRLQRDIQIHDGAPLHGTRPGKRQQISKQRTHAIRSADYVRNIVAGYRIARQVPFEKLRIRDNGPQRLLQIVTRGINKMLQLGSRRIGLGL